MIVGTSWYASVFLVVNAGLGAGLLDFPAAYHQCGGIVVAISIQAVRLIFVFLIMMFMQTDRTMSSAVTVTEFAPPPRWLAITEPTPPPWCSRQSFWVLFPKKLPV